MRIVNRPIVDEFNKYKHKKHRLNVRKFEPSKDFNRRDTNLTQKSYNNKGSLDNSNNLNAIINDTLITGEGNTIKEKKILHNDIVDRLEEPEIKKEN